MQPLLSIRLDPECPKESPANSSAGDPYRNKLELVSRMILAQDEYSAIKDKMSVAEADKPVKIA
jgi:hypothetical protein